VPYQETATCISCVLVFIDRPQRVFEVTPLVPGSPSLDVKPHSPGETRRFGILDFRFAIADLFLSRLSNPKSKIRNPKSKYANPLRSF
jgi:hypothetical protein